MAWRFSPISEKPWGGDPGFVRTGYVVLVGPQHEQILATNVAMQRDLGVDTHVVGPPELAELMPGANLEGITAAAYEPQAGYADPMRTCDAFSTRAVELGATVELDTTVLGIATEGRKVVGVDTNRGRVSTPIVIVAASTGGAQLVAPLGRELPLTFQREVACFFRRPWDAADGHIAGVDLLLGGHWRPDTGRITIRGGESVPAAAAHVDDLNTSARFASDIEIAAFHTTLATRFPVMKRATALGGHACVDDVTPDWHPYLGPIPECEGLYCAFGMSSHYFKHSPAVGRLLADLITDGSSSLVDVTMFRPIRIEEGDLIRSPNPYGNLSL
jgi:sarcosine oxidase subunit beta